MDELFDMPDAPAPLAPDAPAPLAPIPASDAELLARAQAGTLPLPAAPVTINEFMQMSDPNKAVLYAHGRRDKVLLAQIGRALRG